MKRLLTSILALLMTVTLLGAAGWRTQAAAEEENPYVGLWQVISQQKGESVTLYEEAGVRSYLDILPNGAIYSVVTNATSADDDYLAYRLTGENALEFLDGSSSFPGTYDSEAGSITVTDSGTGLITILERVKEDPLPDIRALVDHSKEDRTYYGYLMEREGQVVNVVDAFSARGEDPRSFLLTLRPDGTGLLQLGSPETGGEITWTDAEFISDGEGMPYTWAGDHIRFVLRDTYTLEFAPGGEVEALMILRGTAASAATEKVEVSAEVLAGEWTLTGAGAAGFTLTIEQLKEQGMDTDMSFRFNADGTVTMIANGKSTDGISWSAEGATIRLTMYDYELFKMTYDGQRLILSMGADLYFEKVG